MNSEIAAILERRLATIQAQVDNPLNWTHGMPPREQEIRESHQFGLPSIRIWRPSLAWQARSDG